MQVRQLAILFAVLLLAGMAYAAAPAVAVHNADGNYHYPNVGATIDIMFDVTDADEPADANVIIYLSLDSDWTQTELTSEVGTVGVNDRNLMNFCSAGLSSTSQACTYTWTITADLDANYHFDVNVYDITNSDDINAVGGTFLIDTNACRTEHILTGDDVNLSTFCAGHGGSAWGSPTTYYGYSRQGTCPSNINTVFTGDVFSLTFGEFFVCYYSTDGLGNTEVTRSFTHIADSDAYNLALLTELALAGLILFVILGAVVLKKEDLSAPLMIALITAAIIIALSIYIFAVVL